MTTFQIFFFNDTATTEIYTLSLHDALPIYRQARDINQLLALIYVLLALSVVVSLFGIVNTLALSDRKSTRLNSSHANISYAVFCLKKKTLKCKSSSL